MNPSETRLFEGYEAVGFLRLCRSNTLKASHCAANRLKTAQVFVQICYISYECRRLNITFLSHTQTDSSTQQVIIFQII